MAGGRPTDYNPEFHPADCERLGSEGRFKVEMASEWDVDTNTIDDWCARHPEFHRSYMRAKNFRTSWWMARARQGILTGEGEKFDSRLFGMVMKYDGVNMDERKVKLPELASCKTFDEQSTCIIGAVASGKLTIKEANGIVDIIGKFAKIEEVTELRRKLEAIEESIKQGK